MENEAQQIAPADNQPITQEFQFNLGGYAAPSNLLTGEGFGRRAAARLIDFVVMFLLGSVAGLVVHISLEIIAAATREPIRLLMWRLYTSPVSRLAFSMIAVIVYETVLEGLHGSTIGKLVLGMVVVQEDGKPCDLKSALIRSAAYSIDALFFGIVGYMAMERDQTRQRYGDSWAHTVVAKRSAIAPENLRGTGTFIGALLLASAANILVMVVSHVFLATR
jgi:uncharacterized RDD family membrane protein YckC